MPSLALPPVSIIGQAVLEDVRADLPSTHKALLLVRSHDRLVVTSTIGCASDQDLRGASIAVGEGFAGWTVQTGTGQARANLEHVPPGTPQLSELERSLDGKSAIAAGSGCGDARFALVAFVCLGFHVYVLEDLDRLEAIADRWSCELSESIQDAACQEWLEACVAPYGAPPQAALREALAADHASAGVEAPPDDYTAQDVEVLLSVFGMDLTTKNPTIARVLKTDVKDILKADVGEFLQRDLRDAFAPSSPVPGPPPPSVAPEPASGPDEAPGAENAAPEESDLHYSSDEVSQILSVFGVAVKAGDSPVTRVLGADLGDLVNADQGRKKPGSGSQT